MAAIESYLGHVLPLAASRGSITEAELSQSLCRGDFGFRRPQRIAAARQKYAIDCMYGAGRGVLSGIFTRMGIDHVEIRSELNPLFPGIQPEPIPPHIRALEVAVLEHHCQAGFATDGDADRIGAVDEEGRFVDANKIYCLLLEWLLKRKQWPGDVARGLQHHQCWTVSRPVTGASFTSMASASSTYANSCWRRTSSSAAKNQAASVLAGICRNAMGCSMHYCWPTSWRRRPDAGLAGKHGCRRNMASIITGGLTCTSRRRSNSQPSVAQRPA